MNNFLHLTKINILSFFKNVKIGKGGAVSGVKWFLKMLLVTAFVALIMFSLFFNFYPYALLLHSASKTEYIFLLGGGTAFMFVLFYTMYEGASLVFKAKDFEMLSALPIKKHQIVLSKLFSLLITGYAVSFVILVPCLLSFFVLKGFSLYVLICFIFSFLVFPIIPLGLSLVFSLLILYVATKTRYENLFNIILMLIFTIGIFVVMYSLQSIVQFIVTSNFDFANNFWTNILLPNIVMLFKTTSYSGYASMWLLIFYNIAIAGIIVWLVSVIFHRANNAFKNKKMFVSNKEVGFEQKSQKQALHAMEFKKYYTNTLYLFNTSFGLLFMPFIPILFLFTMPYLTQVMLMEHVLVLNILAVSTVVSMSITTNSSISLEGKYFSVLKSLPLSVKQILKSKAMLNIFVVLPFVVLTFVLSAIVLFNHYFVLQIYGIILVLMQLALPLLSVIAWSCFGLLTNLMFPKINYDNVTQVVKQSASVFISLILPLILNYFFIALPFIFPMSALLWLGIYLIYILTVLTIILIVLKKYAKKMFNRIS